MNERDRLQSVLDRVLDRHPHQALGSRDRDRLDADAGVEANLLLAAFQHVFVQELDQAGAVGSSLLPLDAGVNVFRVLAEDNHVHALGMFHRRGHALVILHRAHAGIEIEDLAQRHVERADATAHGRGQRAFDGDAKFADRLNCIVGQPVIELGLGFFSGEDFVPGDAALALVGFLDRCIEYAQRSFPNVTAGAVALNEGDDRVFGNFILAVGITDFLSTRRYCYAVIRASHHNLRYKVSSRQSQNP